MEKISAPANRQVHRVCVRLLCPCSPSTALTGIVPDDEIDWLSCKAIVVIRFNLRQVAAHLSVTVKHFLIIEKRSLGTKMMTGLIEQDKFEIGGKIRKNRCQVKRRIEEGYYDRTCTRCWFPGKWTMCWAWGMLEDTVWRNYLIEIISLWGKFICYDSHEKSLFYFPNQIMK